MRLIYFSLKVLIIALEIEEVTVSTEYLDFANIFFSDSKAKLSKHFRINNYSINLAEGKQLLYKPIYNMRLMKLKTLKSYIEINLASGFIKLLKTSAGALILFVYKKNGSLQFYINYQRLINLTIENCDLLLLFVDSLD